MITSITYNLFQNKSYKSPSLVTKALYGEKSIPDLEKELLHDADILKKAHGLVSFLNSEHSAGMPLMQSIGAFFSPDKVMIKQETKKKRKYFVYCLTIHEEDIVTA